MAKLRKKLGQYLVRWGVLDETQLKEAIQVTKGARKRLDQVLVEMDYATEEDVAKALASQFNLEFHNVDDVQANVASSIDLLPQEIIKKFLVLPISKDNGKLKVLLHDPMIWN